MKIGYKLILIFFSLLVPLAVVYYVILFNHQKDDLNSMVSAEFQHIEDSFRNIQERDTAMLASTLEAVVHAPSIMRVYTEKDREKLYDYGQPLFQSLKGKYGITLFYFIEPDGRTFLRLHNWDIHGDVVRRFTFQEARDTNRLSTGLELGKTAFALRAVKPYYDGGRLIGYVELGEEIEHFFKILKAKTNNEFAIIVGKEFLDRDDWASVRAAAGLEDTWDALGTKVLLAATSDSGAARECFTEESIGIIKSGLRPFRRIHSGDGSFACGGFGVVDAGGRSVGMVLATVDITAHVASAEEFIKLTTLLMALVSVIIAIVGVLLSRYIARPVGEMQRAADEIARGNLDMIVNVTSRDELGALAYDFNEMTSKLKTSYTNLEHQIEQRKKLEKTLRLLSTQDGLTGLANRRHFNHTFRAEWRRALRERSVLSVILIDIDFFKDYNDTYGHLAGDDCLRAVGASLDRAVGRPGDLVARYGGEEFVVVLPGTGHQDAMNKAEQMRRKVQDMKMPHKSSAITGYVTISAGVASAVPDMEMLSSDLIDKADRALYRAKQEGRNRVAEAEEAKNLDA